MNRYERKKKCNVEMKEDHLKIKTFNQVWTACMSLKSFLYSKLNVNSESIWQCTEGKIYVYKTSTDALPKLDHIENAIAGGQIVKM